MNPTHREELLDSAIEESFPASDPVSVFVDVPQRPLPWEKPVDQGFPWRTAAAFVPVALGVAGAVAQGLRVSHARRGASMRKRRQLAGLTALGILFGGAVAIGAALRRRRRASESGEDVPLFV